MFAKFSILSILALVLPLVSSLSISAPANVESAETITITWTSNETDPSTFNIYLVNAPLFHTQFAVANSVNINLGTITFTVPTVQPGSGYTFEATPVSDINNILSQTPPFDIAATSSSSVSSTSSAVSSGSVSAPSTTTSVSGSKTSGTPTSSSSGFGTTSTAPPSSSGSVSGSSSSTGSASTSAPSTTGSNAAVSGKIISLGSVAGMILGLFVAL